MTAYLAAPSDHVSGTVRVPGDKSISHRALMLGGIAEGITEVRGFLESEDCLATMRAMRALGVQIEQTSAREVRVQELQRPAVLGDEVLHLVHGAHAARPEHPDDPQALGNDRAFRKRLTHDHRT